MSDWLIVFWIYGWVATPFIALVLTFIFVVRLVKRQKPWLVVTISVILGLAITWYAGYLAWTLLDSIG